MTSAPRAANCFAASFPTPGVEPVMRTRLPCIAFIKSHLRLCDCQKMSIVACHTCRSFDCYRDSLKPFGFQRTIAFRDDGERRIKADRSILPAFRVSASRMAMWVIGFAVESKPILYSGSPGSAHDPDRCAADAQGMLHFRKKAILVEPGSSCYPADKGILLLPFKLRC